MAATQSRSQRAPPQTQQAVASAPQPQQQCGQLLNSIAGFPASTMHAPQSQSWQQQQQPVFVGTIWDTSDSPNPSQPANASSQFPVLSTSAQPIKGIADLFNVSRKKLDCSYDTSAVSVHFLLCGPFIVGTRNT